jgi:hypothetical protein
MDLADCEPGTEIGMVMPSLMAYLQPGVWPVFIAQSPSATCSITVSGTSIT